MKCTTAADRVKKASEAYENAYRSWELADRRLQKLKHEKRVYNREKPRRIVSAEVKENQAFVRRKAALARLNDAFGVLDSCRLAQKKARR